MIYGRIYIICICIETRTSGCFCALIIIMLTSFTLHYWYEMLCHHIPLTSHKSWTDCTSILSCLLNMYISYCHLLVKTMKCEFLEILINFHLWTVQYRPCSRILSKLPINLKMCGMIVINSLNGNQPQKARIWNPQSNLMGSWTGN